MQSSDISRALLQVKFLIEELNKFIECLQNAPPANVSTREKDEAIEEATKLCLTLSSLENSGIFEINAAAIHIPQLRPLFIELQRYERCRKSMTILQGILTRDSEPTLTTDISESLPATLPEGHERYFITRAEAKETPKPHRFKKMITVIRKLRRNQQHVIKDEIINSESTEPSIVKDEITNSESTEPNTVKEVNTQGVEDQSASSQKELTYTVWKIRGVSSFLNGLLADWVSTEIRGPEAKWEAWKIEVFKLAGWRSDIVVQSEPQKSSAQTLEIVQGHKEEFIKGNSRGRDDSRVIVSHKFQGTSTAVVSYTSETVPAKCGRCLGFFHVEPRCVCH